MRVRNADKLRERQFNGGETIMGGVRRYDGGSGPRIIRLRRRQFIAATYRHEAALRGMTNSGVSPYVG